MAAGLNQKHKLYLESFFKKTDKKNPLTLEEITRNPDLNGVNVPDKTLRDDLERLRIPGYEIVKEPPPPGPILPEEQLRSAWGTEAADRPVAVLPLHHGEAVPGACQDDQRFGHQVSTVRPPSFSARTP